MTPTLKLGTLVIDKPTHAVHVGDIATFTPQAGEVVTHRIKSVTASGIRTQGDANHGADWWTLRPSQIIGTTVTRVPYAGYLLVFMRQPSGAAALLSLALAVWLAWGIFFDDKKTIEGPESTTQSDETPALLDLTEAKPAVVV